MSEMQRTVTRNVRILMATREMHEQRQLADLLGWTSSKMTKTFRGDRKWALDDLSALADALGVTPSALLGDTAQLVGAASQDKAQSTLPYPAPEPASLASSSQVTPLRRRVAVGVTHSDSPEVGSLDDAA